MSKRLVLMAVVWLAGFPLLRAQDAPQAPPPPHVAEKAPDLSRWAVEYQYEGKAGEQGTRATANRLLGKRITQLNVTKSQDIKHEQGVYEDGVILDVWIHGGLMVLKDPGYAHKIVRRKAQAGGDFPEFQWIKDAGYRGTERVNGKECLVFQHELYPLQFADPGLYAAEMAQEQRSIDLGAKVPVVAHIDAKTRLPVKLTVGDDARIYTFLSPPPVSLIVPADYEAAIQQVDGRYKALSKPLSKP